MTADPHSGDWYVRSEKGVLGPLKLTEISVMLRQGIVRSTDPASLQPGGPQWIKVREIPGLVLEVEKFFQPPPRPAALQSHDESAKHPPILSGDDFEQTNPTLTLFDALQAAKDRRPRSNESPLQATEVRKPWIQLSPKKMLAAVVVLAGVASAIWGFPKLFDRKSSPSPEFAEETPARRPPPAETSQRGTPTIPSRNDAPRFSSGATTSPPGNAVPLTGEGIRRGAMPRSMPHVPPVRERERVQEIAPENENRGSFDDPVDARDSFSDAGNDLNDADVKGADRDEDLAAPPHGTGTTDLGNPEPLTVPEGSSFPAPSFD